jgi:hypothetical protein
VDAADARYSISIGVVEDTRWLELSGVSRQVVQGHAT